MLSPLLEDELPGKQGEGISSDQRKTLGMITLVSLECVNLVEELQAQGYSRLADDEQTDGQTGTVNQVIEDVVLLTVMNKPLQWED